MRDVDYTDDDSIETDHNLNESFDKVRIKTQIKRGEGTRDQDTHDIKVRAPTSVEAAEALSNVIAELERHDVFGRVRALQPDVDDENDDDTEGDADA